MNNMYNILNELGMIDITEEEFNNKCSSLLDSIKLAEDITTENDLATIEKLLVMLLYKGE